nr:SPOR domain-containing protein [Clostridium gasigenes]
MKIGGTSQEVVADETVKKEAFESVQCGYFSKEENANKVLESLGKSYNSFVVKDEEKFRVLAGVFTGQEGDKALNELKDKGIEAAKVKFTLDEEDKVQEQISAISDGYFKIVTTLKNNEVKAVSTSEFKGWTKELPEITEGDKKEIIGQFKKHIEELPSELKKENLTDELKYIYTILINFKR